MRVGREEREACIDALQGHYAAGRLQDVELSARVEAALTAVHSADLEVLVDDLPGARRAAGLKRPKRPWVIALAGTVAIGIAVAGGLSSSPAPVAAAPEQPICAATGLPNGTSDPCPAVSDVQQQITTDADQADRIAQQLQELAERNPDKGLDPLIERAWVTSGRAGDALRGARQLVIESDGEPSKESLADLAATSRKARADTEKIMERALDLVDG